MGCCWLSSGYLEGVGIWGWVGVLVKQHDLGVGCWLCSGDLGGGCWLSSGNLGGDWGCW